MESTSTRTAVGGEMPSAGGRLLVRATSVEEAETRASQLLSPHRLRVPHGDLNARIHGISLGSVALYHMNYGTGVTVSGPPLDGYVGALIPLRGSMRVTHGSAHFRASAQGSAAVITPSAPMRLEWSHDLVTLLLRIDTEPLEAFARSLTGRDDSIARLAPHMTDPACVAGLLGSARLVELAAEQLATGDAWPSPIAARIREQVMLTLLLAQPAFRDHLLHDGHRPVSREAVRAATELVESDPTGHMTTPSLAAAVGVSVRALQVGFRDVLDCTPHEYVLEVRLRRAREDLLAARPDEGATVTGIARRWGFGNVGRFAEQYQNAHGEKPSETLRQC